MQINKRLIKEVKKILEKNDPSHDFQHIMRVYQNSIKIGKKEGADMRLLLTSVLLHEIVSYPKSDRRSAKASTLSSLRATKILKKYNYSNHEISIVAKAIRDHSFSKGIIPNSLEGKILQDADRLDALGSIGIARTFAVAGAEKRSFYNEVEPFRISRDLNDKKWTMDHFYKKLLILEKKMHTKSAKKEAARRRKIMVDFILELKNEI